MKTASRFVALIGFWGIADITWAHTRAQSYDLPAPLWLYTLSVVATVIASVAIASQPRAQLRDDLVGCEPWSGWLLPPIAIGSTTVSVFIALLIASSIGDQVNDTALVQARPVRITMPPGITFERCLTLTPNQTLAYQFQADQPLVFDIHYHVRKVLRHAIPQHPARYEKRMYRPPSAREYCLTWQNPASESVAFSWAFAITTSSDNATLVP